MNEITYAIRRSSPRFTFIAEAEVIGTGEHARISELSARGCYIDTLNPLPKGTDVQLRIRYGCSTCEFPGKVLYMHAGFGMGVVFSELKVEQSSALAVWLEEVARKTD